MTTYTIHRTTSARATGLFDRIANAFSLYRQRRQLADLDAHMRADLGLTEADILRETNRSIWDAPQSWRA
ncbi:DUF1127 domain-containing protein [Cognatishimia sp. MH4019]|uniref:DUF1127 domain-containing protein n=1 Tax=Cognatishimia sp. MH4019 TaxID=2854030 RepID=UPI001CD7EA95|nr:DUF1127 domain-containing protein [Cognatishimia sp. MH4019]